MKALGASMKRSLLPDGDLFMENSKGFIQALNSSWDISF
jgi:hypothetical protein